MKTSVALCTFNGQRFIEEQLLSLLNQTIQIDEIVIIDDCSTDKTAEIIQDLIVRRRIENVRFAINTQNIGFIKNFEHTISQCTGEIIFLCDQDDKWDMNKIKVYLDEFSNNPNCLLLFSNAHLISEDRSFHKDTLWKKVGFKNNKRQLNHIFTKNYVTGATVAFQRELLKHCMPFDSRIVHDYWLVLNSICVGAIKGLNKKMISYRIHQENTLGLNQTKKKFSILFYLRFIVHIVKVLQYEKTRLCVNSLKHRHYLINKLYNKYSESDFVENNKKLILKKIKNYLDKRVSLESSSSLFYLVLIIQDVFKLNYWKYDDGFKSIDRDLVSLIKNRM